VLAFSAAGVELIATGVGLDVTFCAASESAASALAAALALSESDV